MSQSSSGKSPKTRFDFRYRGITWFWGVMSSVALLETVLSLLNEKGKLRLSETRSADYR